MIAAEVEARTDALAMHLEQVRLSSWENLLTSEYEGFRMSGRGQILKLHLSRSGKERFSFSPRMRSSAMSSQDFSSLQTPGFEVNVFDKGTFLLLLLTLLHRRRERERERRNRKNKD